MSEFEFVRDDSAGGNPERLRRPPANPVSEGRPRSRPARSVSARTASLCAPVSKVAQKIGDEIAPADIERIGYADAN